MSRKLPMLVSAVAMATIIARMPGAVVLRAAGQVVAQPQPSVPDAEVLRRFHAYLGSYGDKYSSTVADETYEQNVESPLGRPVSGNFGIVRVQDTATRLLQSVFGIIRMSTDSGWIGVREVKAVDGTTVKVDGPSLTNLTSGSAVDVRQIAQQITAASAAFNVGPVSRTTNNPALLLQILDPSNEYRFTFTVGKTDTVRNLAARVVSFVETAQPTLIHTSTGISEPLSGHAWVDDGGRLLKADVVIPIFSAAGTSGYQCEMTVVFGEDARMGFLVPISMDESYGGQNIPPLTGHADYRNYRKFGVDTSEAMQVPAESSKETK